MWRSEGKRRLRKDRSVDMKRGTPEHPKTKLLAQLLNIEIWGAVGLLELLWHFTAKYAPRGDIGRYSDREIAAALHWQRPTGERGVTPECKLSEALVTAKWVDRCPVNRLVVHDWPEHADQAVTKFLSRHRLSFVRTGDSLPEPEPEPMPVPDDSGQVLSVNERIQTSPPPPKPPAKAAAAAAAANGAIRPQNYPLTAAAVHESFPTAGEKLIGVLVRLASQAAAAVPNPHLAFSDEFCADAVRQCLLESPGQRSPGLFLTTVPRFIDVAMRNGLEAAVPKPPQRDNRSRIERIIDEL